MTVKITVNGNQIDLKDMVQGGTYDTKRTIGLLSGLPTGKVPKGTPSANIWAQPIPINIKVDNVDISAYYEARNVTLTSDNYNSATYTIPTGCTKMKIILINGGQSGSGLKRGDRNRGEYGKSGYYYVNDNIPIVVGKTTFTYQVGQGGLGTDWDTFTDGTRTIFTYNNVTYSPENTYISYTFPDKYPITIAGFPGAYASDTTRKNKSDSRKTSVDSDGIITYTPLYNDNANIEGRGWPGYCGCVRVFFLFENNVNLQPASQPVSQPVIQPVTLPNDFFTGIFA